MTASPIRAGIPYARELGWAIVPLHDVSAGFCSCAEGRACKSAGKHPRLKKWAEEATSDVEQITSWSRSWPSANVGVATGAPSGFFVLDVDPEKGGFESLKALIATHGELPRTALSTTGSAGNHYLFQLPEGVDLANTAGRLGPGLDTRGTGGQIVLPPSRSSKGPYTWLHNPFQVPIAAAPAWLLDLLTTTPAGIARPAPEDRGYFPAATAEILDEARSALAKHGPAIDGQGGGLHTVQAAAIVSHDFALTDDEAWPLLCAWNQTCQPPWELEGTNSLRVMLGRGRKYGKAQYGAKRSLDVETRLRKLIADSVGGDTMKLVEAARPLFEQAGDRARHALMTRELEGATGLRAKALDLPAPKVDRDRYDDRTIVRLVAGELHRAVDAAERGLIAKGAPIFQRGSVLVRPVSEEVDAARGRKTHVARLREVTAAWLETEMSRCCRFERFDARTKAWVAVNPPPQLAHALLARSGDWRFKVVAGVITTPTIRPDGSILREPGYDPVTRLLLVDPPAMPQLELTQESARASLARIEALLLEFPFVDEASRSVALSAILTTAARGACEAVPAHAASASTAGTGKSFLWDVAAALAIGQRCPVLTAARDEAELEKRLGAALLAGQPIISLDNMTISLSGDALAQVIERPLVDVRILGRSEIARIESKASVFATGNNLTVAGDLTRRVLLARLEAHLERPELRQFRADPFATVLASRAGYVADALTVVAAYAAAGRPGLLPRLASFGQWSDTVRSALVWLGKADPCATMEAARAEDPLLGRLRSVVSNWREAIGPGAAVSLTASELLARAEQASFEKPDFADSVREVASNRGRSDARTLGKWLARNKDRIVDGLRICGELNTHSKVMRWWVAPCAG